MGLRGGSVLLRTTVFGLLVNPRFRSVKLQVIYDW